MAWRESTTRQDRGRDKENVRVVATPVHREVLALPEGCVAEVLDFGPDVSAAPLPLPARPRDEPHAYARVQSRLDDEIYAAHHDVWERVPRGCAVLRITAPSGKQQLMWAMRWVPACPPSTRRMPVWMPYELFRAHVAWD
jgi:hypothetical protein